MTIHIFKNIGMNHNKLLIIIVDISILKMVEMSTIFIAEGEKYDRM